MNNTDNVYVGWIHFQDVIIPEESYIKNIKVFTNKAAARKWKYKLNYRNQKTFLVEDNEQYNYDYAGFDELMIDRESK